MDISLVQCEQQQRQQKLNQIKLLRSPTDSSFIIAPLFPFFLHLCVLCVCTVHILLLQIIRQFIILQLAEIDANVEKSEKWKVKWENYGS